jgi:hypothetical protein
LKLCVITPAAKSMPASQTSQAGVAVSPLMISGEAQHEDKSQALLEADTGNMVQRVRRGVEDVSMGWRRAWRNLVSVTICDWMTD